VSDPRWGIEVTPRARRDVRNLDPPISRRVREALEQLVENPAAAGLVRLQGSDELRLRIGDWRVRLRLDTATRTIVVLRVLPRGRAYRD
jgi:mRNA-degrading endonuclease RelE of RelBE toxin-antitoxin system